MNIKTKIKLKIILINILFELFVNSIIILVAYLFDRIIETLFFYIAMAKEFLVDPDASVKGGEKLAIYHDCIVDDGE